VSVVFFQDFGSIFYNYLDRTVATTAIHEFASVCAVVGGMLAQDILKALGVREAPLANFFTFDGNTGAGNVVRMTMT
jgi:ubiquitin-like 1-activating enzyme E1 A